MQVAVILERLFGFEREESLRMARDRIQGKAPSTSTPRSATQGSGPAAVDDITCPSQTQTTFPCTGVTCGPQRIPDDTDCSCWSYQDPQGEWHCCGKINKRSYYYTPDSSKGVVTGYFNCGCGSCEQSNCGVITRYFFKPVSYTRKVCAYSIAFTHDHDFPWEYVDEHTCYGCCSSNGGPCPAGTNCTGTEICSGCGVDLSQKLTITLDELTPCRMTVDCPCPP